MTTSPLPTSTSLSFDLYAPHELHTRLDFTLTLPDSLSARARLRLTHALAMSLEAVVDAELQRIAAELDSPVSEQQLLALGSDESAAVLQQGPDAVADLMRQNGVAEDQIGAFLAQQWPSSPTNAAPQSVLEHSPEDDDLHTLLKTMARKLNSLHDRVTTLEGLGE
ncbi:hypothetical protein [Deinococcus sp. QL22]|uniref:hypothetical protein n=1 Tax=Deinococcus sp. QL22 TaxID=2939437 RepID=UPI002017194C|nr:hypothetical protein [Deinococcus sp. QL22]UQN10285.1 hypothetical protein M1R55_29480 [Deinococcus sp. QL22]UQN10419.1 hypothetical protein M1R55_28805 [Deinococcus sp. QL22]